MNIVIQCQSILDDLTENVFVEDDPALDGGLNKVMVDGRKSRVNHEWNEEEKQRKCAKTFKTSDYFSLRLRDFWYQVMPPQRSHKTLVSGGLSVSSEFSLPRCRPLSLGHESHVLTGFNISPI